MAAGAIVRYKAAKVRPFFVNTFEQDQMRDGIMLDMSTVHVAEVGLAEKLCSIKGTDPIDLFDLFLDGAGPFFI